MYIPEVFRTDLPLALFDLMDHVGKLFIHRGKLQGLIPISVIRTPNTILGNMVFCRYMVQTWLMSSL